MAPPDPRVPPLADREIAVRELIRGREVAARLGDVLRRSSAGEGGGVGAAEMAEQVLTSLSKALQVLEYSGEISEVCEGPGAARGATSLCSDEGRSLGSSSGQKRKPRQPANRTSSGGRRRRTHSYQLTVRSKTTDDGQTWRKYGQKGIQSAAHPRSYFRCTHKHDQGCQAVRQVQRCEDDPSLYAITYIGQHTCTKIAGQRGGAVTDAGAGESYLISFGAAAGPAALAGGGGGGSTAREFQVPPAAFDDDDALSNLSRNDSSSEFLMLPELEAFGNPAVPAAAAAASDLVGDASSGLHSCCVSPSSCQLAADSFPLEDMFSLDHDELDFMTFVDDCDR